MVQYFYRFYDAKTGKQIVDLTEYVYRTVYCANGGPYIETTWPEAGGIYSSLIDESALPFLRMEVKAVGYKLFTVTAEPSRSLASPSDYRLIPEGEPPTPKPSLLGIVVVVVLSLVLAWLIKKPAIR